LGSFVGDENNLLYFTRFPANDKDGVDANFPNRRAAPLGERSLFTSFFPRVSVFFSGRRPLGTREKIFKRQRTVILTKRNQNPCETRRFRLTYSAQLAQL
jgi:hypothetical protein